MGRRIRKAVYWQDAPIVREQGTTEHTEHTEARHNRATIPFRVFRVFRGSEKRDSDQSSSRYRNNRPRHISAPGDSTGDSIRGQTSKTPPLRASSKAERIRSLRVASLGSARAHHAHASAHHAHARAHHAHARARARARAHARASRRLGPLSCSSFHCNNQPNRRSRRHLQRMQGLKTGRLGVPSSSTRQEARTRR